MSDSHVRPEPWRKIDDLLQSVLDQPEELRAAFLESACAGNEGLRREVESLMAHHAQAGSFLETPPADAAADVLAQEQARLTEGQLVGHYKTLALLGVGGMGEVYLAEDTRLRRQVAIKLLPTRFTENQDRVRRFELEARAASALNHPNIVTIHEIGRIEGTHFIVTEFIEGQTLRQRMTGPPMMFREVLDAAIQITSALGAAHAAGIIHRDIKPENIMLRPDGLIKVLDFGLAKLVEDQDLIRDPARNINSMDGGANTELRLVLGTLRYMSPEQARGEVVDTRTDIFSLGVVLFEMVTGRSPFGGASAVEVVAAILNEEPPPLTRAVPGTPSELEWIETKALAKDRDERYQTARELQIDLKRLKQEVELKPKLDSMTSARWLGDARARGEAQTADESRPATPRVSGEGPESARKGRTLLRRVAFAAVILFALYAGMKLVPTPATLTFQPLTFRSGSIFSARFDPDGGTVFYTAAFDGGPIQTFRKGAESGAESTRFGPEGASVQSVSKTQVAMLLGCKLHEGECHHGTLAWLPLDGNNIEPAGQRKDVWDAEWSEIAQSFATVTMVEGGFQLEYPTGKVLYESPNRINNVRVSPDGKMVAFIDYPHIDDAIGSVKIFDDLGKLKTSSRVWTTLRGLAWSRKGDKVLFSAGPTRALALRSLTTSGVEETVYEIPGDFKLEDVSSRGQVLAYIGQPRSRIAGVTPDPRNLSWFDWSTAADLSSDGKILLFHEWGVAVGGIPWVYLQKLDGESAPKRLGEGKALALSPDRTSVLALQAKSPGAVVNLVQISTSTAQDTRILPPGAIREYSSASWLDGDEILVSGVEQGERYMRSFVQDLQGGLPRRVTAEGEVAVLVSPDKRNLVVRHPNDGLYYLHEYPIQADGREPVLIPGLEPDDEPIQWNDDASALYVRGPENMTANIQLVDLRSGRRTPWKNIVPPDLVGNIGVSWPVVITPGGKFYVYTYWTGLARLQLVKGLLF